MVKQDYKFDLAVAKTASSADWLNTESTWYDFVNKLRETHRTHETISEYLAMTKQEQATIKDVGGYVGGYLLGGKRKKKSVIRRQILTLDLDFANLEFWDNFTMLFGCAAVLHATHKHTNGAPRYRLLVPLDRAISAEEYQATSRMFASILNIELFDPTTFDINRLMFWPSSSSDGIYVFEEQEGDTLNVDSILSRYVDWKDISSWPQHSALKNKLKLTIDKQADPESKQGVIGAFCRTYDVNDAILTFLNSEYIPTNMPDRYTYTKGSTAAGLVLYENGKFAFSHHSTDPCSNMLCNSFDLVRIHKFGAHDIDSTLTGSKLPSFKMMEDFALEQSDVKKLMITEQLANAKYDFEAIAQLPETITEQKANEELEEVNENWQEELEIDKSGRFTPSAANLNLIIRNDTVLRSRFKLNAFDNKRYIVSSLPWRFITEPELVKDVDYSGIRNYIDCIYGISNTLKIDDALALEFNKNQFHPIKAYLTNLEWDNIPRIDTLLIQCMGCEDSLYTREVIRKSLVAAVARVFEPGIKFDNVLVLCGEEGAGKSTLFKKLGKEWFSDTFTTVQGKEAFEQLQGHWIIEMAELSGLRRAEVETVKHFIAKQEDSFRPAYGRTVESFKRQCVFFGTTNKFNFLQSADGNRRFWPVDICKANIKTWVWSDTFDELVDQIWAEAIHLYNAGEPLILSQEAEKLAVVSRIDHKDGDERAGIVEDYLDMLLPENWDTLNLEARRMYINSPENRAKGTVKRKYTCIAEIWCECLQKAKEDMSRYNTRDINDILKQIQGWDIKQSTKKFSIYGTQKYYERLGV